MGKVCAYSSSIMFDEQTTNKNLPYWSVNLYPGIGKMYTRCRKRSFLFRTDVFSFYPPYVRWLSHLSERLGAKNALSIWKSTFTDYNDTLLLKILSSDWKIVNANPHDQRNEIEDVIKRLATKTLKLSNLEVRTIIENTPPIPQIKMLYSYDTVEKEITTFDALHIRFDGLACLAESLLDIYGKQGELIIYDLMIESRLDAVRDDTGSIEEFIQDFTAKPDTPNLFTAGLETQIITRTSREVILHVLECEWARYYRKYHPNVGYLMACSTDEIAYKAFNPELRMQRTQTLMEGGEKCDFRIYAICDETSKEK